MLAEEVDDGHLGGLITSLDSEIRVAPSAHRPALVARRRILLLRLADAALEFDAPLPGAQAEYEKARACEAACDAARAATRMPAVEAMPRFQLAGGAKAVSRA